MGTQPAALYRLPGSTSMKEIQQDCYFAARKEDTVQSSFGTVPYLSKNFPMGRSTYAAFFA